MMPICEPRHASSAGSWVSQIRVKDLKETSCEVISPVFHLLNSDYLRCVICGRKERKI